MLAIVVAAYANHRSDWFRWGAATALGVLIIVLAAFGAAHLLATPAVGWAWVAAGSLISAAGVWAGVPETGPAVVVGGSLAGLTVAAGVSRSRWGPGAGIGAAAALGWAALSGAVGRPWASVGGALCTGVAPWIAVRRLPSSLSSTRGLGPWLLGLHVVLVILAARWIGVAPHAGWHRVAIVVGLGLAVATVNRCRA